MKRIIDFFRALIAEIKAIFKKPEMITGKEVKLKLTGKNKNELIRILTKLQADIDRTLPDCENWKEVKTWPKRQLIQNIFVRMEKLGIIKRDEKPENINSVMIHKGGNNNDFSAGCIGGQGARHGK